MKKILLLICVFVYSFSSSLNQEFLEPNEAFKPVFTKNEDSLNSIFVNAYKKENNLLEGIDALIQKIHNTANYTSQGFTFLISSFRSSLPVSRST